MTKRQRIQETRLTKLEEEFRSSLVECLKQCAAGRWGLFGQNDAADPEGMYWHWPAAMRLKESAREIASIREEFGQKDPACERFLELCSLRGQNIPGEPKLAADFLIELNHLITSSRNQ